MVSMDPIGYQDLLLQREAFEYTDATTGKTHFNGPTMLKLVLCCNGFDEDTAWGYEIAQVWKQRR